MKERRRSPRKQRGAQGVCKAEKLMKNIEKNDALYRSSHKSICDDFGRV